MNRELNLPAAEMRAIGYRVVDAIVEHLSNLPAQPVGAKGDPAALIAAFDEPPPEQPTEFAELLDRVVRDALGCTMHVNHPRFFAYVPGPGNFIGVMADALVSGYNVFAGTWIGGSGAAAIELAAVGWLREICGFPETAGGLFVSGGTAANLTCLAAARHVRLGGDFHNASIYYSDQAHSSLEKDLRLLGFVSQNLRKLPSGADYRLPIGVLARAIDDDRARGLRPFCAIATAGATNTGAIDPLPAMADLCQERGLWLHVDGAYGAAAALCAQGKHLLRGMERADSLSLDPHKWLFQPFEIGCALLRDKDHLRQTFQTLPEYLKDTHQHSAEINFTDYGLQLTRGFRALKLWLSLKYFGLGAFRAAIERGFELAEFAERRLREMPGWEIVSPAQMAVVCFRYSAANDAGHLALVQAMLRDGFALLSSTMLQGRAALRMCPINPRTTEADILESLRRLDVFARELGA